MPYLSHVIVLALMFSFSLRADLTQMRQLYLDSIHGEVSLVKAEFTDVYKADKRHYEISLEVGYIALDGCQKALGLVKADMDQNPFTSKDYQLLMGSIDAVCLAAVFEKKAVFTLPELYQDGDSFRISDREFVFLVGEGEAPSVPRVIEVTKELSKKSL